MAKLILVTEERGDEYLKLAQDWFYGPSAFDTNPCNLFDSCPVFALGEFLANRDGLTLYTARSE